MSEVLDSTLGPDYRSRVRGSLLGGAIGDALGAPVEFWDLARIDSHCGDSGVREYLPETVSGTTRYGLITDDTQMTLFTVEGLIRAGVRRARGVGLSIAVLHHAYDRWLDTQLLAAPDGSRDGWLISQNWLYSRRAPGGTCLSALQEHRGGNRTATSFGESARNDSKGCGGLMRSAPFGLLPPGSWGSAQWQFDAAALAAGFTHGHPTGQVASGALAVLIGAIMKGDALQDAVTVTLELLRGRQHHEETAAAIEQALAMSTRSPSAAAVESLGGGWVAEEALAIAIYAALAYPQSAAVLDALARSVTHSGDSDSTGAICGNILGALHGEAALPSELALAVEGRDTILTLADDLAHEFTSDTARSDDEVQRAEWQERYPGW